MYPILTLTPGKHTPSSVILWARYLSPAVRGKCIAERKHGRSMTGAVSAPTHNLNSAARPAYQKAASQVHRTAEPDRRHCIWIWTASLCHMPVWGQDKKKPAPRQDGDTARRQTEAKIPQCPTLAPHSNAGPQRLASLGSRPT